MIQQIKDIGYDNLTDPQILAYINEAYGEFNGREPWPYKEVFTTLTVDSGTGAITCSAGTITSVQKIADTTNGWTLRPVRLDRLMELRPKQLSLTGNATNYYSAGDSYFAYPIPNGPVYKGLVIVDPADLTGSDEPIFNSKHHHILVSLALEKAATGEDDTALAADYRAQAEAAISRAREDLWKKNYDETDTILDLFWGDYVDYDIY